MTRDDSMARLFQSWLIDTIVPYKVQIKEPLHSLDALHKAVMKLALSEHDKRRECPQLWIFVSPKFQTPLVLHTRWRSNAEKQVIYAALRHMLQASPEITRYGYCGEGYSIEGAGADDPYKDYDTLSVHPDRFEQLMVMSFERHPQRQKVNLWRWPADKPKAIKPDPRYTMDDPTAEVIGDAWNLFGKEETRH